MAVSSAFGFSWADAAKLLQRNFLYNWSIHSAGKREIAEDQAVGKSCPGPRKKPPDRRADRD
jgi:hypothetical protein